MFPFLVIDELILLREFSIDDSNEMYSIVSDERVLKFERWGPLSEIETNSMISFILSSQQQLPRTVFDLAVESSENGQLLGLGHLTILPEESVGEIGFVLGKQYWGYGYGTSLAKVLIRFAIVNFKIKKIIASCSEHNIASIKVLKKAGMTLVEFNDDEKKSDGIFGDSLYFELNTDV